MSFKTSNVSGWIETILEHFGPSLATSLNDGKVVKVLYEANKAMNAIKINFYDTYSVVIQGAKCALFADTYSQILKNKVNQTEIKSFMTEDESRPPLDIDSTPKN